MSGYVIEIPQEKENSAIWSRQLRVAAYCRVSTPYEEQQKSLEKQIEYFTQYIKRNPFWRFVAVYADNASGLHAKNRPGYQKMSLFGSAGLPSTGLPAAKTLAERKVIPRGRAGGLR